MEEKDPYIEGWEDLRIYDHMWDHWKKVEEDDNKERIKVY